MEHGNKSHSVELVGQETRQHDLALVQQSVSSVADELIPSNCFVLSMQRNQEEEC